MIRQHAPECVVPSDLPTVSVGPWWHDKGVTEYAAEGPDADVAGYSDAPGVLTIDGGEEPVPIDQAERHALATLAVVAAMRAAGLGTKP